jgi:hypothetical protein
MAAPEYVPVKPMDDVRSYESPPRRPEPWMADRPGDLEAAQPSGALFGKQGPDQGYALVLARLFRGALHLEDGEHEDDAVAGCLGVALKRSSLLGRAPLVHDWRVAFTVWGFRDPKPADELVALRRPLFAEVAHPNHYLEQRHIADAVPPDILRKPHAEVESIHSLNWRDALDLSVLDAG